MSNGSTTQTISDSTSSATSTTDQRNAVQPVSAEDSEHFQQMLKNKQQENASEDNDLLQADLSNSAFNPLQDNVPAPQTLVPNLLTFATNTSTISNTDTAKSASSSLQQIIETIVQSMSISDSHNSNGQEIRIVLKEDVLPATEIRINASNHQLVVQFITASGAANQWLDQRLFTMQSALERVLNRSVDVSVFFAAQEGDESPQQGKQSS